jgi:hypothetical protein
VSDPEADPRDAAFEERVRASREETRKSWKMAALFYIGPCLLIPALFAIRGDLKGAYIGFVVLVAFFGIPFALAMKPRRPS